MTAFRPPPSPFEPFSVRVQLAADRRGWTVRDLASQAGLTPGTVHRVVTGRDVMLSTALKIAAALGMDTADLGHAATLRPRGRPRQPDPPPPPPYVTAEPQDRVLRCRECALCDKPSALICNDPPGICHPGECQTEPE